MDTYSIIQALIYGAIGWLTGLLVNYLADVLPLRRRIDVPVCRYCGRELRIHPSMVLIPQRCGECHRRPVLRWIMVQAVCLSGFIVLTFRQPEKLGQYWAMFWLAYLLLVIVIDIEHRLILHVVSAAGAAAGILIGIQLHGLRSTLAGGLIGFSVMLTLYGIGIAYARWSSRRWGRPIAEGEALGFGDVTFSLVMGFILGSPGVFAGLVTAILLAGAAGLLVLVPALIRRRYDPNLALPYGPFLALAIFYLLFLRG